MKQILTIAVFLTLPFLCSAQTGFYIQFEGINGPKWGGPFHQWFEAESMDYKLTQSGTTHMGGGSGAGKVTGEDMKITMNPTNTTQLQQYVCNGRHLNFVRIAAVHHSLVMKYYYLEDVMITSYELRTDENGKLIEEIWLDFSKVKAFHGPENNGTPFKWDFPRNTAW